MTDTGNGHSIPDSKVLNWLKKQGYSLEMRVAQVFKEAGFEVSQFETYVDPESNDLREIDVVASIGRHLDTIDVRVTLFVECKYARKPWVIFTSPRRPVPFAYFSRILRGKRDIHEWKTQESLQGRLLARILLSLGRQTITRFSFFHVPQNAGYGMTETLREDTRAKDNAYIAIMQVTKCLEAHDAEIEMSFQRAVEEYETRVYERGLGRSDLSVFCSIAFPVVVVKGKLFECCLDANNEPAISEVNESIVIVSSKDRSRGPGFETCVSAIRVVSETHLESLAKQSYEAAVALLSQEEAIREVWEHTRPRVFGEAEMDEIPF
jgi:hypothetical protein